MHISLCSSPRSIIKGKESGPLSFPFEWRVGWYTGYMHIDTFNKPSHSDITSACKIVKHMHISLCSSPRSIIKGKESGPLSFPFEWRVGWYTGYMHIDTFNKPSHSDITSACKIVKRMHISLCSSPRSIIKGKESGPLSFPFEWRVGWYTGYMHIDTFNKPSHSDITSACKIVKRMHISLCSSPRSIIKGKESGPLSFPFEWRVGWYTGYMHIDTFNKPSHSDITSACKIVKCMHISLCSSPRSIIKGKESGPLSFPFEWRVGWYTGYMHIDTFNKPSHSDITSACKIVKCMHISLCSSPRSIIKGKESGPLSFPFEWRVGWYTGYMHIDTFNKPSHSDITSACKIVKRMHISLCSSPRSIIKGKESGPLSFPFEWRVGWYTGYMHIDTFNKPSHSDITSACKIVKRMHISLCSSPRSIIKGKESGPLSFPFEWRVGWYTGYMHIDTFNKPSHSDITSACKIVKRMHISLCSSPRSIIKGKESGPLSFPFEWRVGWYTGYMHIDTFNKPSHSDITSACKIVKCMHISLCSSPRSIIKGKESGPLSFPFEWRVGWYTGYMHIDTFNKPSHSDITSACKILKSSDAANFSIILLVSFCFHMHFSLFNY